MLPKPYLSIFSESSFKTSLQRGSGGINIFFVEMPDGKKSEATGLGKQRSLVGQRNHFIHGCHICKQSAGRVFFIFFRVCFLPYLHMGFDSKQRYTIMIQLQWLLS